MTSIIQEIQDHLNNYRHRNHMVLRHLSIDDVSAIKGCHVRQPSQEDYQRSWAKLSKAQRLNRLMNYHQKLTQDYKLDSSAQHQLKTLFYDCINSDILDRDNVQYNIDEGNVVKIDGLKLDGDGTFYIDNGTFNASQKSLISNIKKFTVATPTQLSVAQRKHKPIITLKQVEK